MKKIFVILMTIYWMTPIVLAGSIYGTRGPIYISTAWNLNKNDILLYGNSRFYFKNEKTTNPVTYWDAQGILNLFYGVGRLFEVGLSQIIYQDNHKGGQGYNLPDDLYLKFKLSSINPQKIPFNLGLQIVSRIPLAKHHNLPLEPYAADRIEFSVIGLASYSSNLALPDEAFNAHLNIGYLDHNDVGHFMNSSTSKEFLYGIGIIYPISRFDFSLEFYGNRYLKRPPEVVYSRYNYAYITPGITYQPLPYIAFVFGFDYRLTAAKPNLQATTISANMPVFPTWKANFGIRINVMSKIQRRYTEKNDQKFINKATSNENGKNIYEQISNDRKEVENAEQELLRIREERKRMDEMIERLRNILELKEDTKKKPDGK